MPQAISTIIFVDYFMPQAVGTTISVDYFMPQAIGTITFVDYFVPQAIGTTIFVDYSMPQAFERAPPPKGGPKRAGVTKTSFGALCNINSSRKWV